MGQDRSVDHDPLVDRDEAYFDRRLREAPRAFDATLLRESPAVLPTRKPILLSRHASVTDAMRAMQNEHRGVVVITRDGTPGTPVVGVFTERDVLFRIVDGGRNPAVLPVGDVMTENPECLHEDQTLAEVLELMSVGGFRHVPVVDAEGRPLYVVSVRDVVQFLVESFPREVLNRGSDRTRDREGG
jgi:CBS domain-containing protein